jgi:transcriptional regulator with XRE-family HTH domain
MTSMKARLAHVLRATMRENPTLGTQQAIAKKSGMGQATVSRILNEEQSVTLDMLENLASGLHLARPEFLFLRQDEVALLGAWGKLTEEERARILGYIEINAQMRGPAGLPLSRTLSDSERKEQQIAARFPAPELQLKKDVAPTKARPGRPPKRS